MDRRSEASHCRLAALADAAMVEYYDHNSGAKAERVVKFLDIKEQTTEGSSFASSSEKAQTAFIFPGQSSRIVADFSGVFQGSPNGGGATFDLFGIRVTLYCTPDGNMAGQDTPPVRGAEVMFECGGNAIIVKGRTNDYGFSYSFGNQSSVMPFLPLQSNCNIVINTTLSNCNSTLPSSGGLRSGVKFVGTSLVGNLVVANFAPTGFRYVQPYL